MIKQLFALASLSLCGAVYADPVPAPATAYIHCNLYTGTGAPIPDGTLIVAGGKVVAAGKSVAVTIPAGSARVDLHGAVVIPGLIDAASSLFVSEETISGAATADQNVLDGIDPFDRNALKALQHGVTSVYVSPGTRGGIGGLGGVVKITPRATSSGASVYETTLKSKAGLEVALGLSSAGRSSSLDRLGAYQSLKAQFTAAKNYLKAQEKAEADKKAAAAAPPRPAGGAQEPNLPVDGDAADPDAAQRRQFPRGGQRPGGAPTAAPRSQPIQETLAAALKGEIPVRIEAHRADDILNALRLKDEFHFKLVLVNPDEAGSVLPFIKDRSVSVIWTPARAEGAPTLESNLYASRGVSSALAKAGVTLAVSPKSSSGIASRMMLQTAQMAIASGLSPEAALKAVTSGAAAILGVGDKIGSLEKGKDADFVILTGSPYSIKSHVTKVYVNGDQVYAAQ
jgi:imidazolonepropionase-like amidohydrolase